MRRGADSLWLGVAYIVTDCLASLRLANPEVGSPGGGGGSGSGVVLVDKLSIRLFKFERGELVVIKSPEEPSRRLVRRLIGLEGDWVLVAAGKVERVPKGAGWVEADSGLKAPGGDSRVAWGSVPLALIEGRVSRMLWPPARWGALTPQPSTSGSKVIEKAGSLELLAPPARKEEDCWSCKD